MQTAISCFLILISEGKECEEVKEAVKNGGRRSRGEVVLLLNSRLRTNGPHGQRKQHGFSFDFNEL